jgi:hypothetical protein
MTIYRHEQRHAIAFLNSARPQEVRDLIGDGVHAAVGLPNAVDDDERMI